MGIVSEERTALLQLFQCHFRDMWSRQLKDKTVFTIYRNVYYKLDVKRRWC